MDRYYPAFIIRDYDRCKQDRAEGSLSHRCRRIIVSWHRLGDIFALAAKKDQPEVYDTKRSFGSEATDVNSHCYFAMTLMNWPAAGKKPFTAILISLLLL